jgi:hypothetical protein
VQVVVAIIVAATLNVAILMVLRKRYEPKVYRVVSYTYLCSISLRYLLAFYLWTNYQDPGFSMMFWGDSATYDSIGAAVAENWSNGSNAELWKHTVEGRTNRGFLYVVAAVYYVFGRNVLLMQLLNGIIGTLTSICILELGLLLYKPKVATRAMLFAAFFPQMIFWSSGLYKDPTIMLCVAVNMLSLVHLKRGFRTGLLFVYLVTAAALIWLRFYLFYVIVATMLAGFMVGQRRKLMLGLVTQISLVLGVIMLLVLSPIGREVLAQQRYFSFQQLQRSRADLAAASSGYARSVEVSSASSALRILPIGVAHILFSPFPWAVRGLRQYLALPDVLAWYLMVPFLIKGMASAIKNRLGPMMPILLFTTALTLAYGVFQGNAGTAYRQRTQIMMFYFLFVADGLERRKARDEEAFLEPEISRLKPCADSR